MKIALLQTGKTTEKHVAEGVEIYCARIRKFSGFEIITVPDLKNTRNMSPTDQKSAEGKKIIRLLGRDDYIVLLDEKGREFSSVEFARWIQKRLSGSAKRIVFIVGGPWGFSDEMLERADLKISLSKMTFPHQLVRLLFTEQLYRAFTIIRNEPYHHQ